MAKTMNNMITTEAFKEIHVAHTATAAKIIIDAVTDQVRAITNKAFELVENGVEMNNDIKNIVCRMMNGEDVTADDLNSIKINAAKKDADIRTDMDDIFRRTRVLIGTYVSRFTPAKADAFARKLIVQYMSLKGIMSYNIEAAERNNISFRIPDFENHNILVEAANAGMENIVVEARRYGILPDSYFDAHYTLNKMGEEKYRVVKSLGPIPGDVQKEEVKARLRVRGKRDKEKNIYVTGCKIPGSEYIYILEEDLRAALDDQYILISRVDFVDPVDIPHKADFSKLKLVGVLKSHGYSATIDDDKKRHSILLKMRRAGVTKADVTRALKFLSDSSIGRSPRASYQEVYFQDWKFVMKSWAVRGEVSEVEDVRIFDRNQYNF